MAILVFVNLPVKSLARSVEFFTQVGYTFDPRFTDENATCMVISDTIYAMLLVEPFFRTMTGREVCDAAQCGEVAVALSTESRAQVDEIIARAVAAGATTPLPSKDYGFMYSHSFRDLDGHLWEYLWMDPSSLAQR